MLFLTMPLVLYNLKTQYRINIQNAPHVHVIILQNKVGLVLTALAGAVSPCLQ